MVPGPYQDLSGLTARAQIRSAAGTNSQLLAEMYAVIPDQADPANYGSVLLSLTPQQTAAINANGVWDMQLQNGDLSDVRTYVKGRVTMEDEVTQV
jgi:hypothetical protein